MFKPIPEVRNSSLNKHTHSRTQRSNGLLGRRGRRGRRMSPSLCYVLAKYCKCCTSRHLLPPLARRPSHAHTPQPPSADFYDIVIHYFLCLHRKPVNGHRRSHIFFKIILISVDEIGQGPRGMEEGKENVCLAEERNVLLII